MVSRADQHDLDKLDRWYQDLVGTDSDFPVYAVFLVSEADRTAHDVFRAFRASFEARNAGFRNLVIFGQHGVSTTVHALLEKWGLSADSLPVLVLLIRESGLAPISLTLPAREGQTGLPDDVAEVLSWIEHGADGGKKRLRLDGVPELTELRALDEGLPALVKRLIENLG